METASAFDPASEKLIDMLRQIAFEELPEGWTLRAVGSYISDTGLAPAILDLALVFRGQRPPPPGIIVDQFVGVLKRRAGRAGRDNLRCTQDAESPSFRLLASNFDGPSRGRQEIAIIEGEEQSGVMDSILRQMLSLSPPARPLVRRVKLWARCRQMHLKSQGLQNWTLLVVFFLQQKQMLPALQDLPGCAPTRDSASDREIRLLLSEFAQFTARFLSRPHPRDTVNIWIGKLVPTEAPPAARWAVADESVVVQELIQLQQAAAGNAPWSQPFQPLLRGRSQQGANEGRMAESHSSHSTPPPVSRPEGRLSAVRLHGPTGPMPPLPGSQIKEAGEVEADGYMSDCIQASAGFEQPMNFGGRWHVDADWLAYKRQGPDVLCSVQLDPEAAGELTREGWARRFNRREYQIRLGKATREYRRWSAYALRHGMSKAHPTTPRVSEQNTKKEFEAAYAKWRVKLHQPLR